MSRPPRPHYRNSVIGDGASFRAHRDYLPIGLTEFVEIERELLLERARVGVSDDEGDFAKTLMELSGLLAQSLGVYQDLYAREAYISTAETAKSLVRHARRLAYEPDSGLAATGFVALTIGEGLKGVIPRGFALASAPSGEIKAQTFETVTELEVDAARNEALPALAEVEAFLRFQGGEASFRLETTGLDLEPGGPAILTLPGPLWLPVQVVRADEDDTPGKTLVTVRLEPGAPPPAEEISAADCHFVAKPELTLRLFGWNSDVRRFPPLQIRDRGEYQPPSDSDAAGTIRFGYQATTASGGGYAAEDVYLANAVEEALVGGLLRVSLGGQAAVVEVTAQEGVSVAFIRGEAADFSAPQVVDGVVQPGVLRQVIESSFSTSTTALQFRAADGANVPRSELSLTDALRGGWTVDQPLTPAEPNRSPASDGTKAGTLKLAADLGDFRPGGFAAFSTLDGSAEQIVAIRALRKSAAGQTEIDWESVTAAPVSQWLYSDLKVLGNVGRISHGESVDEILGGSDGVTPFLRFELKKAPITRIPGMAGGEPEIEVRFNDVEWERVEDFYKSGPDDRHYRVEIDEEQKASVIFGNGARGAIPPSGRKHIRARYRFRQGEEGNAPGDALRRIKKSHPLVEDAFNPTPTVGGAPPARLSDLRTQATRYIRTFDRAVSVQDHADLALLFPGVARAAARLYGGAVELVIATADGAAPDEVRKDVADFLEARRDAELPLRVEAPVAIDVLLTIAIEHAPAYLADNIRLDVQDALLSEDPDEPGLFAFAGRFLGQAAHLSHVYERVGRVEGADFIQVTRFALEDEQAVYDVLRVEPRQWLRLQAQNLQLSIAAGGGQ